MNKRYPGLALLVLALGLCGCATNRSELKVSAPAPVAVRAAAAGGPGVYIHTVVDERVFEQAPPEASTPSLGFEGASGASDETKARAIGRKRNGFGKALGDVLLERGQTMVDLVRSSLAAALSEDGYAVRNEPGAQPAPIVLDVHVRKFWAWVQPGFWAITVNTNIETAVDIAGVPVPTVVSVHIEDPRQFVTDGAWMEGVQKALKAYREEARQKLAGLKPPG